MFGRDTLPIAVRRRSAVISGTRERPVRVLLGCTGIQSWRIGVRHGSGDARALVCGMMGRRGAEIGGVERVGGVIGGVA